MSRTNDPLDEVIRVEAVADCCGAEGSARAIATAAAGQDPEAWSSGDDTARLTLAAAASPRVDAIRGAIEAARRSVALATWIAILLAGACGIGAVAAALPSDRTTPTNVFWMIAGVLGVQTVLLAVWIIAMVVMPNDRPPTVAGRLVGALGRVIARRLAGHEIASRDGGSGSFSLAVGTTLRRRARIESRSSMARWGLGLISNGMWSSFNLAGLATALLMLSSRQYEFAWESTILGPEAYVALIDSIAWLPQQLGFPTPDAVAIAAGRFDPTDPSAFPAQTDELRARWSGLLLGSMVLYGLAPRLLLATYCLHRRRRARRRVAVDPTDPAVAAMIEAVRATSAAASSASPVELDAEEPAIAEPLAASRPVAAPAIVGIELPTPASGWPPQVGLEIDDLGIVASGSERHLAERALSNSATRPSTLVAVCEAATTPDRGVASAIRGLVKASASPGLVVVSGGERLRRRDSSTGSARRLADWRSLAEQLGTDLVEIDLDHLTAASRRSLAVAIAAASGSGTTCDGESPAWSGLATSHRLGEAFQAITAAARGWHDADGSTRTPTAAEEVDLHRRIVRIFEGDGEMARWPFPPLSPGDPAGSLQRAASRIESMLPASLRLKPAWLAAGAVAGALGCIAAATLVTPLAISALPVWSTLGGAVGALLSTRTSASGHARETANGDLDLGPSVASAVLQAVLLAHQGMGERAISDALEAALGPDEPPMLRDADAVSKWCRTVERRLTAGGDDSP